VNREPYRYLLSVNSQAPATSPRPRTLFALREHKILCVGVESLMTTSGCVKIP